MMGRMKKTAVRDFAAEEAERLASVRNFCGCCNKKFSKDLRKTKKFVVNSAMATDGTTDVAAAEPKTTDISQGIEEILTWRHGRPFTGTIEGQMGLCTTCGVIVAKLYTAVKLFEDVRVELSYLNKVVEKVMSTESKGTDTTEDTLQESNKGLEGNDGKLK